MTKSLKVPSFEVLYHEGTPFFQTGVKVDSIDFEFGRIYGICGATGSGKSSFCRAITGISAGRVNFLEAEEDFKPIGKYVFQQPEHQFFAPNCREELEFGLQNFSVEKQNWNEIIVNVLSIVGLDCAILDQDPRTLSGGQKRRLAIASVLSIESEFIIFDEPTAGLDPYSKFLILNLIQSLKSKGMLILWVSHELSDLALYCDECLYFEDGCLKAKAMPVEVLNQTSFCKDELCEKLITLKDMPQELNSFKNKILLEMSRTYERLSDA